MATEDLKDDMPQISLWETFKKLLKGVGIAFLFAIFLGHALQASLKTSRGIFHLLAVIIIMDLAYAYYRSEFKTLAKWIDKLLLVLNVANVFLFFRFILGNSIHLPLVKALNDFITVGGPKGALLAEQAPLSLLREAMVLLILGLGAVGLIFAKNRFVKVLACIPLLFVAILGATAATFPKWSSVWPERRDEIDKTLKMDGLKKTLHVDDHLNDMAALGSVFVKDNQPSVNYSQFRICDMAQVFPPGTKDEKPPSIRIATIKEGCWSPLLVYPDFWMGKTIYFQTVGSDDVCWIAAWPRGGMPGPPIRGSQHIHLPFVPTRFQGNCPLDMGINEPGVPASAPDPNPNPTP